MGGIIIIFTYITRVMASSKILGVSPRGSVALAPGLFLFALAYTRGPSNAQALWPGVNLRVNSLLFMIFLVAYLLLALIRVFTVIEKEAGPLKIK